MNLLKWFLFSLPLLSFTLHGADCSPPQRDLLPKFFKARSTSNGNPLLLKVAQAKSADFESCSSTLNEVGWVQIKYVFRQKAPLRVVVLSSTPGSFFWKTDRTFFIKEITLEKKQKNKELYRLELRDPKSQARYDFEISPSSPTAKLRIK